MDNKIGQMLDAEIEKTLETISTVETNSDNAKAALNKLDRLHSQRMRELEAELRERERKDTDYAKTLELELRKAELEAKVKQMEAELNQKVKQMEYDIDVKKAELAQKEAELKEAKKGRWWRTVLDVLGIAVPTVATGYWLHQGFKFEEEGKIYTSRTSQFLSGIAKMFGKKG